jgi:hypothetical protein
MEIRHEIEKLAYELYEKSGRKPGHEFEHWIEAEKIVCSRRATAGDGKAVVAKKGVIATKTTTKSTAATNGRSAKISAAAPKVDASGKTASAGRSKKTTSGKKTSL